MRGERWLQIALVLVLVAGLLPAALGAPKPVSASGEQVKGELNGWGTWSMTGSLGGTFIHTTGQVTAADDSASMFKFFKDSNLWYGNGSALTFAQIYTNFSTSGGDSSFNHIQNSFYVFKWNGNDKGVIFQLSSAPATISGVSQSPVTPGSANPVDVTATTNTTPPSEQALWVRYTTDNWASSTVVKMSGSGTSYTAQIPAQAGGTTVAYYIFSSGNVGSIAGTDADLMTITYNNNSGSNYSYTVSSPPGAITVTAAKALWLDAGTIAWNGTAGTSYKLLYDPDGGLTTAAEGIACTFPAPAAPCYVTLTTSGTVSGFPKNPNATGLTRLLTGLSADNAKHLLQGQVVVASYNSSGTRLDATRVQAQSALDALYAASAKTQTLGVSYSGSVPTLKVWAPTAKSLSIRKYEDSSTATYTSHVLSLDAASGVWSVTGAADWDRDFYLLDVEVYVPSADTVLHNLVSDPYAVTLSQDGAAAGDVRSQFVNLADSDLKPTGWDTLAKPALANFEDITVYEMHVRDFSINDGTVSAGDRGTYKAFTYDGTGPHPNTALSKGMDHLLKLQDAGLTHVHLLPAFDIASVTEPAAQRTEPTIPAAPRDSDQQQAAVAAAKATDGFNWGYDPYHYGVPEGSYATNPDGVTRVLEFREMVQALNQNGLRVVMDVVYNHTAASGQDDKSVLDKVVPGYYYRYDTSGTLYNSSCCSDTAAEYEMMEKLMIDTVLRFAVDYKVDGFRFDLMNLHTRQNMLNLQTAVQALTVGANGVDGSKIYLYGEGWDFGSAAAKGLTSCPTCYAKQYNMTGTGIGTFNDKLRDAAHGGYSADPLQIRHQGFINGLSYDWNGYEYANRYQSDLHAATADLRTALAGSGGFYTDDPQETINYVEKHDNETLFDQNVFKLPVGTAIADRVRAQNMGTSLAGLAQGIPFIQMGQDILRSKSLDRNSYDSGDWFNRVDWTYTTNHFGSGLPPAWDNSERWTIMSPLLTNTTLDPATANIEFGAAHLREILRLRRSSALFRLTTEADANARVSFYNTDNSKDALIVMALSDSPAPDLDAAYETLLVFFNANKIDQTYAIAGANGFSLHPLHTNGVDDDEVIATATFNDTTDTFSIPARTTVVFVSSQVLAPAVPPSTLDWVGLMYPRGGIAHAINQGAFAPSGFDVYVQVYESGWTEGANGNPNIACTLHWGEYGGAWNNLPMTWNTQIGNNDEYKATLSQATLNALPPGTYGFTTNCNKTGEGPRWKTDSYNIGGVGSDDDQGDGLLTVIPTADSSTEPEGGVFVHLFEWRWQDIQKECAYLAEKGYSAVQVSPPQEHLVPTADMGGTANDFPWWVRYQPVTHRTSAFTSRSGTWAEFQSMVNACNALGVDIYVDAVINHMADIEVPAGVGAGTAGTAYDSTAATRYYGTQYQADDFHTECTISDYGDRYQVQRCKLSGLPDLDTGKSDVQTEIRGYLQALINAGVKGFRIDGAKHMAAQDTAAIFEGLTGEFYVFQEVIDQSTAERVRDWETTPTGDVTEFAYAFALGAAFDDACGGSLSDLEGRFDDADMLPSRFAQVFTDNHDNQRGHGVGAGCVVDHRDGQEHVLANIFALAYPYGHPSVMSSYYWQPSSTDNTGDSMGPPTVNGGPGSDGATLPVYVDADAIPDNCTSTYTWGKWACEHRRTATANMVRFRSVTAGEAVTNWQNIGGTPSDHIAFGLGAKGFVAINRTGSGATTTYQTGMPQGVYCDIVKYDFIPASGKCVIPGTTTDAPIGDLIVVNGDGQIVNQSLATMDAFAIHTDAPIEVDFGSAANSYGLVWHTQSDVDNPLRLGATWRGNDGVTISGFQAGQNALVTVNVQGVANSSGRWLRLWFDWDMNGVFDDSERVKNRGVDAGDNVLTVAVPAGISTAIPYRVRLYDAITMGGTVILAEDPDSVGGASGGEVEDGTSPVPTAIVLSSFGAAPQSEGIRVTWETAMELQNLGFNLYRGESFTGPWVKLNAALIPAQNPGATFGANYEWLDTAVTPEITYFYRLEDVSTGGASTFHGPVSATAAGVTVVQVANFGAQGSAPAVLLLALATAAAGCWKLRRRQR